MIPKTITKKQLLAALATCGDDDNIYFHTRAADAEDAIAVAKRGGGDELFFHLTGEVIKESDGVSLIAKFDWEK